MDKHMLVPISFAITQISNNQKLQGQLLNLTFVMHLKLQN